MIAPSQADIERRQTQIERSYRITRAVALAFKGFAIAWAAAISVLLMLGLLSGWGWMHLVFAVLWWIQASLWIKTGESIRTSQYERLGKAVQR